MLSSIALLLIAATGEAGLTVIPSVEGDALFPPEETVLPSNGRIVVVQEGLTVFDITVDPPAEVPQISGTDSLSSLVFLDLVLEPGAVVQLLARCDGCVDERVFAWSVGPDPDTTPPAYSAGELTFSVGVDSNTPRRWGVSICVPPLSADEPTVHLLHAEVDYVTYNNGTSAGCLLGAEDEVVPGTFFYFAVLYSDAVSEICVAAKAIDTATNIGTIPRTCIPLESDEAFSAGCAQSGTASPCLMLVAALACLTRRGSRRRAS